MSSRTPAADDYDTIGKRISELQQDRDRALGIKTVDIEMFNNAGRWYHRALTPTGLICLQHYLFEGPPGWYSLENPYDEVLAAVQRYLHIGWRRLDSPPSDWTG